MRWVCIGSLVVLSACGSPNATEPESERPQPVPAEPEVEPDPEVEHDPEVRRQLDEALHAFCREEFEPCGDDCTAPVPDAELSGDFFGVGSPQLVVVRHCQKRPLPPNSERAERSTGVLAISTGAQAHTLRLNWAVAVSATASEGRDHLVLERLELCSGIEREVIELTRIDDEQLGQRTVSRRLERDPEMYTDDCETVFGPRPEP